jgi:O-antigen/teichoic acid export membrane protein
VLKIKGIKSDFFKNVLTLSFGTVIAQLMPFLALPILQKYFYTPSDFGLLAVFITFFELISSASTFKLEFGIVAIKEKIQAIHLAVGATLVSFVVAFILLCFLIFTKDWISSYYGVKEYSNYFLLLPLYIVLLNMNDILSYWNNKLKSFKTISKAKVTQSFFSESFKLSFGFLQMSFIGLLIGRLLGFLFSFLYYLKSFVKNDRYLLKSLSFNEVKNQVKLNKKFVYFSTPSVFLGSLINVVYINLFLAYFGSDVVGNITISMSYTAAAFGLISVSFSQVFYSKISQIENSSELKKVYKTFAFYLFLIALVPLAIVYTIPSFWIVALLGSEWSELLIIARIMIVWQIFWFVSSSLSFIYIRLGRQKEMMLFDVFHLLLIPISFYSAFYFEASVYSALWGFTLAQMAYYVFTISVAIFFINQFKKDAYSNHLT